MNRSIILTSAKQIADGEYLGLWEVKSGYGKDEAIAHGETREEAIRNLRKVIYPDVFAILPNKNGAYVKTRVPQYILEIFENITNEYDYIYRLRGVNSVRPGYGIDADLKALGKWVKKYHSDFEIKRICEQPKNYYGLFYMTDPVAHQLEKSGILK